MSSQIQIKPEDLRHEQSIVWVLDPSLFVWVRECSILHRRRRGPIRYKRPYRVVGYSELRKEAPSARIMQSRLNRGKGQYARRLWVVLRSDLEKGEPWSADFPGAPECAVDPTTISAGIKGQRTPRVEAWRSAYQLSAVSHAMGWRSV
jgi:Family of unknown function (DUF6009)